MSAYAGIGSRATPPDVLRVMTQVAQRLRVRGFTLRSGAAAGADRAFEAGAEGAAEIYLPWPRFEGHSSTLCPPRPEAYRLAELYHPAWARLSDGVKHLQARNSHQVLGWELDDPVAFVVCWTPWGDGGGGTGQALRIARAFDIPVFDLGTGVQDTLQAIGEHLQRTDTGARASLEGI